jgi:hypothetical protein
MLNDSGMQCHGELRALLFEILCAVILSVSIEDVTVYSVSRSKIFCEVLLVKHLNSLPRTFKFM